jgi:hypothetical protein
MSEQVKPYDAAVARAFADEVQHGLHPSRHIDLTYALRLYGTGSMVLAETLRHYATLLEEREEQLYCPTCKSCGEPGCDPPVICHRVRCLYGDVNVQDYKELVEERERMVEVLGDSNALYVNILRGTARLSGWDALQIAVRDGYLTAEEADSFASRHLRQFTDTKEEG